MTDLHILISWQIDPIALRKAKIVYSVQFWPWFKQYFIQEFET